MERSYYYVADSPILAIVCGIAIIAVLIQASIFFKIAWKRALELGFTKAELIKVVKSSAIFSIIPSLPILVSFVILMPLLGRFFVWLRLSVIGSASYETMAAQMAMTSLGFEGISNVDFSADVYGSLMWVVTLGMFLSSISALVLKSYDKKMKSIASGGFGTVIPNIMFLGMLATLSAPYLVDITNIPGILTIAFSAVTMITLSTIGKKNKTIKEFAFSLSMVAGMAVACIVTAIIS